MVYDDVVSEVGGISESQAHGFGDIDDAEASSRTAGNLTEEPQVHPEKGHSAGSHGVFLCTVYLRVNFIRLVMLCGMI